MQNICKDCLGVLCKDVQVCAANRPLMLLICMSLSSLLQLDKLNMIGKQFGCFHLS